jgi:hypothetical protein
MFSCNSWCPLQSSDGSFFCSPTSCEVAQQFQLAPEPATVIRLTPAALSTMYVEYGSVPPFALTPCLSITSSTSCGAVAWSAVFSTVSQATAASAQPQYELPTAAALAAGDATDLSSGIQVISTTACTSASDGSGGPCLSCSAVQASMPGACLPGVYTFRWGAFGEPL